MRSLSHARSATQGFTLVELMIAVAVIGILATLSYSSYAGYARRGRTVEALAELSTVRVRLEQYYQDNRNYGSTASVCGVTMPAGAAFTYTCNWSTGGTSQTFLVTATGRASVGMNGFVYTVDDSNSQKTTLFEGASVTANCWLKKRGETC